MKYCPICDERYDEDVIRFCTKDGTPLVDDSQPNFTELPSQAVTESDIDFGEETIIRRKPIAGTEIPPVYDLPPAERIVIPTDQMKPDQTVRPRTTQAYYPPQQHSNTSKTVILTIIGTLAVLGVGFGIFSFLQKEAPTNVNINRNTIPNQNVILNTNLGFDSNFNFNTSANYSTNFNIPSNFNTNIKVATPTPTPKPSPTLTPATTPSSSPSSTPNATPTPRPSLINSPEVNVKPSPTGTPRIGPRPPPLVINRPAGNR
ncbi:hypothetical protein BH10ACI2_BH10ACI2_09620 [soil metagenome]